MNSSLGPVLMLVLLVVAFYFLVLRPSRNRQREMAQVAANLVPGQRIMLASGLYGTVHAIHDRDVEVEIAPGVVARFLKEAVARMAPDEVLDTDRDDEATIAGITIPDDASGLGVGPVDLGKPADTSSSQDTSGDDDPEPGTTPGGPSRN